MENDDSNDNFSIHSHEGGITDSASANDYGIDDAQNEILQETLIKISSTCVLIFH